MENILQISLLKQIFYAPTWKAALYIILAALFNFIAPIADFIILLTFLIIADFITGIWAAKKRNEAITSRGFRSTFLKVATYAICIVLLQYIKILMFSTLNFDVAYAVTLAAIIVELKSLLENAHTITGVDLWAVIKDKIK
ncbi:phage holin family protein [Arcicella sp. LKC2W]|uniref:phage holin family protein n=1 Tax=Arcicella sp. LKC2W TaxID=2984198 RepID=UPI002B2057B5|nr:phage holin family protein [Arcicella sp. LKC2W]MEA5458702.1 phage holin family protein [Arcicella sp. LKC2W]